MRICKVSIIGTSVNLAISKARRRGGRETGGIRHFVYSLLYFRLILSRGTGQGLR